MRDIDCKKITETVSNLFQDACLHLPEDVLMALKQGTGKGRVASG